MMISRGITKDGKSERKAYPSAICGLRVKANSLLSVRCGNCNHSRYAIERRVTPIPSNNSVCRKCKGNSGEAVAQEQSKVMKGEQ